MIPSGRRFYKMSGSGNDFIMVDARSEPADGLAEPTLVQRLCARATGVGADGIVFLERSDRASVKLIYLNADGSRAEFCGNATLCTTRLVAELDDRVNAELTIETDSGIVRARIDRTVPEIDLEPVTEVRGEAQGIEPQKGEARIGFAR